MTRPSVMIYVQHLLGIGHFVRARHLAGAFAGAGFAVHLVSGGMPVRGAAPEGVRLVQLPPIRVADATFTPLRDEALVPIDDAFRQRRHDLLLAAYHAAAPAVVVIETFPFGRRAQRFELLPLLDTIVSSQPRPLVVASIRDILQRRDDPAREREMLDCATRWFDAVLVHGDARFASLEESFPLAAQLAPRVAVHYTGFVGSRSPRADVARERRDIVVSAGGGAVGSELLAAAIAAQRESRYGERTWRVLAGPNLPDAAWRRLNALAGPRVVIERERVDLADALRAAFVSVSQAGYNTALDVVASGARAVLVPFAADGQTEQATRAERLADLDLAMVVAERELSPQRLAHAVDEAASRDLWGRWPFATDGAKRSAELVAAMIGFEASPAARALP